MIVVDEILVMQRFRRGMESDTEEVHLLLLNDAGECMPAVVSLRSEEIATLIAWYKQSAPPAPDENAHGTAHVHAGTLRGEDNATQPRHGAHAQNGRSPEQSAEDPLEEQPIDEDEPMLVERDPTAPLEFNPLAVVPRALRTERPRILRPASVPTSPDDTAEDATTYSRPTLIRDLLSADGLANKP